MIYAFRIRRLKYLGKGLFLALGACYGISVGAASDAPNLILAHGKILTVDARDSIAEALAVRGGIIVAIGKNQEILRLAGATTRFIDLRGRTATPGLIDSHAHITEAGLDQPSETNLSDAASVTQIVRREGDQVR
jgi:predicted amidohydrolase YtcJ